MQLGTLPDAVPGRRTAHASAHAASVADAMLACGRRFLCAVLVAAGLAACRDQTATAPRATSAQPRAALAFTGDSLVLEPLARGLAGALADAALRRQVVEDLRDSPFPEHGIHAASYFAGPRGRPVLDAMARTTGQRAGELLALVARTPDLALLLPVRWDRVSWTGDSVPVTVATARTKAEFVQLGRTVAFTADGGTVPVMMDRPVNRPVVALLRADRPFGADPEGVRGRAPRQGRRTVTTDAETYGAVPDAPPLASLEQVLRERSSAERTRAPGVQPRSGVQSPMKARPMGIEQCGGHVSCICYWDPSDYRCPAQPTPTYNGVKTQQWFDFYNCRYAQYNASYYDADGDGLDQQCEYELAYAFRPHMKLLRHDQDRRREEYWAAYPAPDGANRIQLFYAFSYYYDRGSPIGNSYTHQGDSEFVVVRVSYFSHGYWQVSSAFYAAHWRSPTDASQNVAYNQIEYPTGYLGRPLVWVAREKHACYNTRLACDRGAYSTDTCDDNVLELGNPEFEAEVGPAYNLGNAPVYTTYNGYSRYFPGNVLANCVYAREISSPRRECLWFGDTDPYFRGWQNPWDLYGDKEGSSPYGLALASYLYY